MIQDPHTEIFARTRLLVGDEGFASIARARVIIFGVGGVGSWCAESLVRSGVGHLTMVDVDRVSVTNINRQLMATTRTVGQPKVDVLRARLLEISPDADIEVKEQLYSAETAESFGLLGYDYVIDAIDSLEHKAHLLVYASSLPGVKVFSSMGAALKLDPFKIGTAEFWKVNGCPLARALRQYFKRTGIFPKRKIQCVYSPEVVANRGEYHVIEQQVLTKNRINGTMAHTTAIFGFALAGLLINDILKQNDEK